MNKNIYLVNSSSRVLNSNSRKLTEHLVNRINQHQDFTINRRDIGRGDGLKFIDEVGVTGLFIPEAELSEQQKVALQMSDQIVKEAFENDTWVIGLPIYNFSAPATFKTWADMLARSNKTFRYIDGKPVGLLKNKRVFVVLMSGGTEMDSEIDFCTPWLRQFMRFIGVDNLEIINATKYSADKEKRIIEEIDARLEQHAV